MMDQGARVGELARTYVPGGVLIDLPYNAFAERLAATEQALLQGSPAIYEAAFRADNVFVSVDILERRGSGHCLVEVKSTTGVKEHHLADVAIQTHVLRRSGLDVRRMEVMHLNRACTYPDLTNLFVRADVTEAVEALLAGVPRDIAAQTAMLAGALPNVAVGAHCSAPYECPFTERCWPELPPHHVSTLYAMRRRALELDQEGYHTIHDLPEDVALGAIADRQRRAVQTGPAHRGAGPRPGPRGLRSADRLPGLRDGRARRARVERVPSRTMRSRSSSAVTWPRRTVR